MGSNPLEQFSIKKFYDINLLGLDISITNSSIYMLSVTGLVLLIFSRVDPENHRVPGYIQILCEKLYSMVTNMIKDNTGSEGMKFFPLIFSIFMFILFSNLFGMLPYGYTVTSSLIVNLFLASIIFFVIIIAGFLKLGTKFLRVLAPEGIPIWLAPLIVIIELFTFLARPVSLCLRLTANMVAGHVMLKVIASFAVSLPFFVKIFPASLIVLLIGFEIFIAILQAYIFTILSCVYLSDAVNSH